ncbi:MAG TPA: alpha/beta fold hydrolase [Rhodoblastus sp.]|nr:alpha/beta fold hydrolase [Rhodoblastus sp.]
MIPVVFDNCRGWLHPRTEAGASRLRVGGARRGVVICGAHGFEDLCSRSSMRLLAEELSARGLPTLRFDWRGTADSEGDGEGPHRVALWLGNVGDAARKLVEMTGVDEIVLIGLRLGALLALEAARDIAPVRLVLLAPPASGRALKRELEVMSRIFQGKPGAAEDAGFDGVSAAGFRISRQTLDDLALVGSRRFSGAKDCATLVLTQNPDGSPLADKLRDMGADVTISPFEGYAEMMCDPTAALPPMKAIARIADFVAEGAPTPRVHPESLAGNSNPHPEERHRDRACAISISSAQVGQARRGEGASRRMAKARNTGSCFETALSAPPQHEGSGFQTRFRRDSQDEDSSFRPGALNEGPSKAVDPAVLSTDAWREEAALFGADNRLVGIFCQRAAGERRSSAVIFLNSGGVYHIGWARMFVDMARRLAANGVASLRMDLSGVGDSRSTLAPDRAPLFDRSLTQDVEAAIDWLFARGVRDVSLFGACSGAYQAFHAAIHDRRVTRIALVNQSCFVYGPTYAMQIEAWRRTKAADVTMKLADAESLDDCETKGARALLFSLAKKVVKAGLVRATDATFAIRRRVPGLNLVERWFGELSARGAQVLLVYSENDPGLAELERHLGARSHARTPLPGVRTAMIADADHEMTPRAARIALSETLDAFVAGREAA